MEDIIILQEEEGQKKSLDEKILSSNSTQDTGSFMDRINSLFQGFLKIKTKEKLVFYRLMATMLNAGMSIIKWISVIEKQEKNPRFKNILSDMLLWLKQWKNLSECMDEYPWAFSQAEIWVIRSWEKTWKLNEVMLSLADQVEKVASVSGKLKSALLYPAMIMLVVFGVVFIMMTVVVPRLLDIFEDKSSLPASTNALIFLSNVFVNYWYVMITIVVFVYFWITYWRKTPNWKYNYDKFLLHIPVLWTVVQKVVLSKFSRVFSGLMLSGVSIVESLKIVADAVWNEVYRQRILLLLEDVRQWMKMWESLEWDKLFPDIMVQMIQVWEKSAKLDSTIIKVADFYDEQVDNMATTINKLLEPFIIVFLAVVVGFIAIAIMQPIMNLADTVANS